MRKESEGFALSKFKLEDHEISSATWMKLAKHFEDRLEVLRAKNDSSMSPEKTERLRGRIAEVKAALALSKPELLTEEEFDDDL